MPNLRDGDPHGSRVLAGDSPVPMEPAGRRCQGCQMTLSRYNRETRCGPCQREHHEEVLGLK